MYKRQGTDRALLLEEGLETAESFVTLTNFDEENIFLSLFAKKSSNAKVVAKVNRLPYTDVIDDLDLGSVIYPKYITSDSILPVSYTHLDVYKRQAYPRSLHGGNRKKWSGRLLY